MAATLIVQIAVQTTLATDRELLKQALLRVRTRDRLLATSEDAESGQTLLSATDEDRLNAAVACLRSDMGQLINFGAPQVAYREFLGEPVDVDYTHKKQSGGTGQFGRVKVKVTPGKSGSGIIFKDGIEGDQIPKNFIPAIEKGMREAAGAGALIGFPIDDFDIVLYDGAYHDIDSSALAFEIAGRGAMRQVAQKAGVKLLEPIMKVVVLIPDHLLDAAAAGLVQRYARVEIQSRGNASLIVGLGPMAQLFGYEAELASASQAEGRCAMLFDHWEEVQWGGGFPDDTMPAAAAVRA